MSSSAQTQPIPRAQTPSAGRGGRGVKEKKSRPNIYPQRSVVRPKRSRPYRAARGGGRGAPRSGGIAEASPKKLTAGHSTHPSTVADPRTTPPSLPERRGKRFGEARRVGVGVWEGGKREREHTHRPGETAGDRARSRSLPSVSSHPYTIRILRLIRWGDQEKIDPREIPERGECFSSRTTTTNLCLFVGRGYALDAQMSQMSPALARTVRSRSSRVCVWGICRINPPPGLSRPPPLAPRRQFRRILRTLAASVPNTTQTVL